MVKIRLLRAGARSKPFYRLVAIDERRARRTPVGDARDVTHRTARCRDLRKVLAEEEIVGVRIAAVGVDLDDAVLVAHG